MEGDQSVKNKRFWPRIHFTLKKDSTIKIGSTIDYISEFVSGTEIFSQIRKIKINDRDGYIEFWNKNIKLNILDIVKDKEKNSHIFSNFGIRF